MSGCFYTIKDEVQSEITEKKSRFICTLSPVDSEEAALTFIGRIKKKYYDARHNCSAYILGDRSETTRSSDDGEPQGTAGRPMMDVMTGASLSYTAAVVTRYFGGTLLGTGGLIRAYSQAVKLCIDSASLIKMIRAVRFQAEVGYGDLNMLMKVISSANIKQLDSDYGETIIFTLQVPEESYEAVLKKITEATLAKAQVTELSRGFYEE